MSVNVWTSGTPNEKIVTGTERVFVDNGGASGAYCTTQEIANFADQAQFLYNTDAATASKTLSAAEIAGGTTGVTLAFTGTFGAGGTLTLPTVASLEAVLPNANVGASYTLRIINIATGQTLTVAPGTGWTLNGTMTIATTTWRDFIITINSATAATLQNDGGGSVV